jgi:hypothetical protein
MWRPPDKAMSSTAARFYEVMAASVAGDGRQIQRRAPIWGQPFYSSHPAVCHTLNGAPDATASPPLRYALRASLRGGEPATTGPQQAQTKLHGRFSRLGVINNDGRNKPTTGPARASSHVSRAPSRCDGGWTVAIGSRVVGTRRGTSEPDSACAARSLRAVQRGRSGGMVASADARAVACARCGLAYCALTAGRSASGAREAS